MSLGVKLRHLPVRIATGAYILNSGLSKRDADEAAARGMHGMAVGTYPFLGKIPVLGYFFRQNTERDDRQELLIFITPRILNRQTIAQTL